MDLYWMIEELARVEEKLLSVTPGSIEHINLECARIALQRSIAYRTKEAA